MTGAIFAISLAPPGFIGVGAKFFVIPLLALSFAIVRSLWVRLPPPDGNVAKPD
jgi:hypothetical protein